MPRRTHADFRRSRAPVTRAVGLSLLTIAAIHAVSGCAQIGYLPQAVRGHLDLLARAEPIDTLVSDPQTPRALATLLELVTPIKEFGAAKGLTASSSYRAYSQLDRDAAVWLVTASEPLAFREKTWSFAPFGSFPYLGWYDERAALDFARELERDGWDVWVRGAGAYSTLGWFDDPLLSTMIDTGPARIGRLAESVLHEAMHATVYVPGQGPFNESAASFVGEGLARAFVEHSFGPDSQHARAYRNDLARSAARARLLMDTYEQLAALYASGRPAAEQLAEKRELLASVSAALGASRPLNNAALIDARTYRRGYQQLEILHEACGRRWLQTTRALAGARVDDFERDQQLELQTVIAGLAKRFCRS